MSHVIKVQGLGKRYTIGGSADANQTFREMLVQSFTAPVRRLRELAGGSTADGMSRNEEFWALQGVDFEVQQGDVVGIIGRNGAGKSTLLKVLSRITEPTEGRVEIRGRVASLLEVGTGFHPELTGHENIYLNGAILGMSSNEISRKFDEIVDFAEVEKFLDTPVKRYSSGMYVRLAFAVAAHLEPEILVVDEVLAVGDAVFQKKCLGKMGDVAKQGRTVLFVSHNMAAVRSLCHSGILLERGQVAMHASVEAVVDRYMHESQNISLQDDDSRFPISNSQYGIAITSIQARIVHEGELSSLVIDVDLEASRPQNNIGIGISLTSMSGVKVCVLGPSVTNYVIDSFTGHASCRLSCENVGQYLAGGDYILDLWVAKPRTEYLIRLEDVTMLTIPPRDVFDSGVGFVESRHGLVPLPLRFEVSGNE